MHRCFGANHLEHISHLNADRVHDGGSPLHLEHSHPAYVAREVPLSNEVGQNGLIQS